MPFLMIIILVLAAPKALRLSSLGESFIVKVREIPRAATQNQRALVAMVFFAVLALVPAYARSAPTWQFALIRSMITAIIFLSLVVLTGYSGQISLGHTAFMGIGALTTAHLIRDLSVPVWLAFFLGPLAAVPAGALLGVIAVRVRGLFLALITLAFAFMAYQLFFQQPGITGGPGGVTVPRPPGARTDTAFFYLVLVVLVLFVMLAVNLRSGRTGRVLAAIRDSETASRAVGVNVFKYKVIVFAISAGMAGMGGVLFTMVTQSANSFTEVFIPFYSLVYLTIAVVGGIFSAGGAIAAGMAYGLYNLVFQNISVMLRLELIFFGLGATLALARNPEGMFGEFRWLGGAVLKLFERREPRREALPVAGGQE
jgi:branched-chain amino acid transport system permease protein